MQHISIRKVQLLIIIHHFMDSPWLELLRKKHGTDVHDCFEGTAMEHFAKHYFCGLFKVRHAVTTEQYGQLLESEFQRIKDQGVRQSKLRVGSQKQYESMQFVTSNCTCKYDYAVQNYRIVLPPARGPMVSMCHLKCVVPYGVHVSPKMCGTLWCPCVT